jgi:DNA-binding IclR family transcriptional regulator
MPKSTIHRLLMTLEGRGFVRRDRTTGQYHLGFRIIEMASLVLKDMDLQRWAQPHLEGLAAECGETVDLAMLDDAHVIYLQVIESVQRVKIAAAVGQRLPAFCTATGKAFLAFLPEQQLAPLLASGLSPHTSNTRTALVDLQEDLRLTRERGFAISEQEYEIDINAVAAPILDARRYPVAAIAIVGPSYRMPCERMLLLGQSILKTVEVMARDVGLTALSTIVTRTQANSHAGSSQQGGSQTRP